MLLFTGLKGGEKRLLSNGKTKGKLEGAFFAKPLNYYEKINGK